MKLRLRLSVRMLLFILSAAAVVFFSTVGIISRNFKNAVFAEVMETNQNQAKKYAAIVQKNIEADFNKLIGYKYIVEASNSFSYNKQRSVQTKTLMELAEDNQNFASVSDIREIPYGNITRKVFYDDFNYLSVSFDSVSNEVEDLYSDYATFKQSPRETISGIKSGSKGKKYLEAGIAVPLNEHNQFAGLVAADIKLDRFQAMIDSVNSVEPFEAALIANNGVIISHHNKKWVGQNITDVDTALVNTLKLMENIKKGSSGNFVLKSNAGNDSIYYNLECIAISNTNTCWAILITTPLKGIETQMSNTAKSLSDAIFWGLVILGFVVLVFAISLTIPIFKTRKILNKLALGDFHSIDKLPVASNDEMGEMAQSLNTVVDGLNKVTVFAENIGAGNYDFNFEKLSNNDVLGQAVIEMRNSLKKANAEADLRKIKESQLEWASQGINIFNKVLRVDERSLEDLSYEIIKTLTIYLGAHMGGMYIKTDTGDTEYELVAFIGFNKEKYLKKFIHPEDGLVGQGILEKETIFINDIPANFDTIISGLGKSIPKSVLIVPLLHNRFLVGLIEIESLGEIQKYQVEFVERIAETIASTLSMVKTNARTAKLLDKAQKQAEELEQQEEEMRQNMEEMQATQEEATKREVELSSLIEGFNQILPILEYDTKGKVIAANDIFLKIYKSKKSQIIGKKHKADLFMNETEQQKHKEFWNNLADGIVSESVGYVKSGKDDYWFNEKFIPIKNQYGMVHKVLCVGLDITEQKKTESRIKQIQEGVIKTKVENENFNESSHVIDLNVELKIIDLTYLKMVYKKDPVKIYNILKLYYDTLPSQVVEVQTLAANKDYAKLKGKTNGLKTKMSYLGLKKVYEEFRDIEKLLTEQKNLTEIPQLISGINRHWSLAYKELELLLKIQTAE